MSSDLHWKPHYQFIIPRAYKRLGLLRRVFSSVKCVSIKRSLYPSFVHSILLYCSPLWHPHLLMDIRSLETVQRRATKFIMDDASRDRLLRLNMLPLMMEFETGDILFLINIHPPISISLTSSVSLPLITVLLQPLKFSIQEPSPMFKVIFTSSTFPGYGILYPPLIQTCPLKTTTIFLESFHQKF